MIVVDFWILDVWTWDEWGFGLSLQRWKLWVLYVETLPDSGLPSAKTPNSQHFRISKSKSVGAGTGADGDGGDGGRGGDGGAAGGGAGGAGGAGDVGCGCWRRCWCWQVLLQVLLCVFLL